MWFFVQRRTLKKADTPHQLHKLDLNKRGNFVFKTDIKMTASGKEVLKKFSTYLYQGLKHSLVKFLKKMVEKIQSKKEVHLVTNWLEEFLLPWIPGIWCHVVLTLPRLYMTQFLESCTAKNKFQANKEIVVMSNMNNFAENSGCKQEWISWFRHESNTSWRLSCLLCAQQ